LPPEPAGVPPEPASVAPPSGFEPLVVDESLPHAAQNACNKIAASAHERRSLVVMIVPP
jgi:hypothetical protein